MSAIDEHGQLITRDYTKHPTRKLKGCVWCGSEIRWELTRCFRCHGIYLEKQRKAAKEN